MMSSMELLILLRNLTYHTLFQGFQIAFLPRNSILLHPSLHPSKSLPFLSLSRFTFTFMTIKIQILYKTQNSQIILNKIFDIFELFALIFFHTFYLDFIFALFRGLPHTLYSLFIQLHVLPSINKIKAKTSKPN